MWLDQTCLLAYSEIVKPIVYLPKIILKFECSFAMKDGHLTTWSNFFHAFRIAIRVGNHLGDLVELMEVELHEPLGWSVLQLHWPNGAPVSLFTLQLRILANHQNGRDTHLRGIRLFAPLIRSGLDAALGQTFSTQEMRLYTTIR